MTLKKKLLGLICALALFGVARTASASGAGFICTTYDYPYELNTSPPPFGTSGGIQLTVYTQPNCAGSFVGGGIFCSTAPGWTYYCATDFLRNETQLNILYGYLQQSMRTNAHLALITDGNLNPQYVMFFGY